jgi:hypothetical protein
MKVEDLRPMGTGWQLRLDEKGGKQHTMPSNPARSKPSRTAGRRKADGKTLLQRGSVGSRRGLRNLVDGNGLESRWAALGPGRT